MIMKGIMTKSSDLAVLKNHGMEFHLDLLATIDEYFKKEESETEVEHAIDRNEYICALLASNHNIIVSFEIEAVVNDTVVLSYVGTAS